MHNVNMPRWWTEVHHFTPAEFDCPAVKNSGAKYMDETFVKKLDTLRGLLRVPLVVSSGYRSPGYNKKIGGAPESRHLKGKAADIAIAGEDAYKLLGLAFTLGFTGIGINQKGPWNKRFIHLDMREQPTIWTY